MTVLQRDTQRHTYADYLVWSREYGDELIDGVAWVREPSSPLRIHQEFVGGILLQIASALKGRPARCYCAPFEVRLPKGDEADGEIDTVVQPDLLIVCDRARLDRQGIRGAPDWVAEVLSPSTARHDRTTKLAAYERAGVPETWLVDPENMTLTVYELQDGKYGLPSVTDLRGQTSIAVVAGVSVDWERLLADIP